MNLTNNSGAQKDLESFGYHQELHRTLGFWELTAFGLNYMIPIAPAVVFGFILTASGGTVILPYLLAAFIMLSIAFCYGVLIQKFPMTGSLYSYISHGLNPHIGFVAGWVFLLDYLLLPTVTSMSVAAFIQKLIPSVPYDLCLLLFLLVTGLFNFFRIDLMSKLGLWLLVIGEIVIFVGFGVWIHAVTVNHVGVGHLFSLQPFQFSSASSLAYATAIAILSYLGFDAITTLSEEAIHPKKDIPAAIFSAVLIGCFTMCLTGYLGSLTLSNWQQQSQDPTWVTTVLFHVAQITGGTWFVAFYIAGFLLAMGLFNVVATGAAARLLYGMGRDHVLPKKIFGAIHPTLKTPYWNIIFISLFQFVMGIIFSIDDIFEFVSYGVLLGFTLLNFTVIWLYFFKASNYTFKNFLKYFIFPAAGVLIMIIVFFSLRKITLIIGSTWLVIGLIYCGIRTRGFRQLPPIFHH